MTEPNGEWGAYGVSKSGGPAPEDDETFIGEVQGVASCDVSLVRFSYVWADVPLPVQSVNEAIKGEVDDG
jgi:hypothetical protein